MKFKFFARFTLIVAILFTAACAQQGQINTTAAIDAEQQYRYSSEVVTPSRQDSEDVLFSAIGLVGTPYRYGGSSPQTGFDCSGLIGYVFSNTVGVQLPRTTAQMMQVKAPVVARNKLRSGDIVFFATAGGRRVSHAGIYVGEGRFVHAPSSGGKVRIDSLNSPYWDKAYLQAKRFIEEPSLASNF